MNDKVQFQKKIEFHIEKAKKYCVSDSEKTLSNAIEALKLSVKIEDHSKKGTALNLIGMGLTLKLDYANALKCFMKSLEEKEKCGEKSKACSIYNNIGLALIDSFNYEDAFPYLEKAREIAEEFELKFHLPMIFQNISRIFLYAGDYEKALQLLLRALDNVENDRIIEAGIDGDIGEVYFSMKDYDKALEFYEKALKIFQEEGEESDIAGEYNNMALIFEAKEMFSEALEYYNKALKKSEKVKHLEFTAIITTNIAKLYYKIGDLDKQEKFLKRTLKENIEIKNTANLPFIHKYFGDYYMDKNDLVKAFESYERSRELFEKIGDKPGLIECEEALSSYHATTGNYDKAYIFLQRYVKHKSQLYQENMTARVHKAQIRFKVEKLQKDIESAKAEAEILRLKNEELERARIKIQEEKAKSDGMILNILPSLVAYEIKEKGSFKPKIYDNVTVCLIEFSNLAQFLESNNALSVIEELNSIFSVFDKNFEMLNCEKIKTFENKYLAVGGMPFPDENHAIKIVRIALENIRHTRQFSKRSTLNWSVKTAVNSGKVIGGIVGKRKYLYDIFGDTVNTAARILEVSDEDSLSVSENTFLLIRDHVNSHSVVEKSLKGIGLTKIYSFGENNFYE